mgnify:CR=1 FL=1
MNGLAGTGLKSLPHDARPREKLLARGPSALSDAELLALLLRTGIPGKHVVQLAQELLDRFGGIGGLLHTGADALKAVKGLGPAKRAEVVAVLELARRALAQELRQKTLFVVLGHSSHDRLWNVLVFLFVFFAIVSLVVVVVVIPKPLVRAVSLIVFCA